MSRIFFFLITATFFAACVTKKEYNQTVTTLNHTQKSLDSAIGKQKQLEKELEESRIALDFRLKEEAKSKIDLEFAVFDAARKCGDYATATAAATKITLMDSSTRSVLYDTLAFYHYFYLSQLNSAVTGSAEKYYITEGLKLNPNNSFLLHLKAMTPKNEAETKFTFSTLSTMFKETGDYTYLYEYSFMQILLNKNWKYIDSISRVVLKDPTISNKVVHVQIRDNKVQQTIPVRAVFLYLKATYQGNVLGNFAACKKSLEESLKIAPDYLQSQNMYQELLTQAQQMGYR